MARDRPSPYGEGDCFFTVARGPRMPYAHPSGFPPRSLPGEGQALALREEAAFFYHSAGHVTAPLNDL